MNMINFWDVNWGEDEAKGDKNLEHYFVSIPEMGEIITGKYHYIIGRKGTGKTAIIERLRAIASVDAMSFSQNISLKDFPLPLIRSLRDKNLRDKSQFVPIWSFLILIELAHMVAADQGSGPIAVKLELIRFLKDNFPSKISFVETLNRLDKSNHMVSILPHWLGGQSTTGTENSSSSSIHYQQVISILLEKLKSLHSESMFFLFVDELDEGYRSADHFLRLLLLALLRSVENLSLELNSSAIKFRPVVALRSDIFDRLEDNDLNKLDDKIVRLAWSVGSRTQYSLEDVISARIAASVSSENPPNWQDLIDESDRPDHWPASETLLTYILSRTYLRPRDLIKFLKCCQKTPRSERISFRTVFSAEQMYSFWLHNEFRDEVQSFLPVWRQALQCVSRSNSRAVFNFIWLRSQFENDPEVSRWCTEEKRDVSEIIDYLFEYGVIGTIDKSHRVSYKYINPDASWQFEDIFTLHKGFRRQLRMIEPSAKDIEAAIQHITHHRNARGAFGRSSTPWWKSRNS